MKLYFKRRPKIDQRELAHLENSLRATLRAVQPRPGFVADLKSRLVEQQLVVEKKPFVFRYALYILAGIFGGLIVIGTGVRALLTLLVTLGVIRHVRENKGSITPQPAS